MDIKNIDFPKVMFVTGIGTDVGKSYATGWLARMMSEAGLNVITQKMIQTGNKEMSEDILCHRRIMGTELQTVDLLHLTAPVILSYPASPHLAAILDRTEIDLATLEEATRSLSNLYRHVIIEGAGGLMVPLKGDYLTADYLRDHQLPTIVVVNGQLGSINHALLTFSALQNYGIPLFGVIYNPYFDKDTIICADTRRYLQKWLSERFPETIWMEMSVIE